MYCVNYISFRQLQHTWVSQEKDLADLPEEDITQLQDYTQRANTTAGSAIALLRLNGIHTYKEPVYYGNRIKNIKFKKLKKCMSYRTRCGICCNLAQFE